MHCNRGQIFPETVYMGTVSGSVLHEPDTGSHMQILLSPIISESADEQARNDCATR